MLGYFHVHVHKIFFKNLNVTCELRAELSVIHEAFCSALRISSYYFESICIVLKQLWLLVGFDLINKSRKTNH